MSELNWKDYRIGKLFLNRTKNGREYLRGNVADIEVVCWRNTYKTKDSDVEWYVHDKPESKDGDVKPSAEPKQTHEDDSIPF